MASSQQRRCVFVGNIPYDATEEQLIQICEEVGPVVSFRLVIDRETGKPKGYGFCEYKDEETALSARRNLQGYEINGRQLRVDFAENDKGSDRNREQGRGGPGIAVNADVTKQFGGPVVSRDSTLHQQIGLPLAMNAASVMAGALGGAQAGIPSSSNGLPQQSLGNDLLTVHLAKMSRTQLTQVLSEMKVLATQNYDLARQLLLACPQLPKALFQAQIMLGMVTPQMLQMPNIRQAPAPFSQSSVQGNNQIQQSASANIHGLPPLAPLSSMPQNSSVPNQFSARMQFPTQRRAQLPNVTQIGGPQENLIAAQSAATTLPPVRPQPLGGMSGGTPVTAAMPLKPGQAPLIQNAGLSGPGSGHGSQLTLPKTSIQPSVSSGPMLPSIGFQQGSLPRPATLDTNRDTGMVVGDGNWAGSTNPNASMLPVSSNKNVNLEQPGRPTKLVKLDDGRGSTFSAGDVPVSKASKSRLPNAAGVGVMTTSQSLRADEQQNYETPAPQLPLPPEIESALLQQVKNLTPEQLRMLPPEQQQQVLQLQKMLR